MKTVDLIISPRWLVTVDSAQAVLENHSLVINQGIIVDICTTDTAQQNYQALQTKVLDQHALMPGFVNSHTHIGMNLMRGLADDLALMDWLQNHIWPAEQQWLGTDFVRVGSRLAMAEMIKGGTTCFNEMYFFPEVTAEVIKEVGMRGGIGLSVMDSPPGWAKNAEECFEKGLAVYEQYKTEPLIQFTFAPHSVYTVSDPVLTRVGELAKELSLPINIHVHETAAEIEQSLAKTNKRPLKRLVELGFPMEQTLLVHMTQLAEDDWQVLETVKPNVVHCPESNMKLASGTCPVEQLRQRGINVALGTDGVASNNDLDFFGEMRSASFLAKHEQKNPRALPATETLAMATINGANALGLGKQIGSLELGKSADCVAVDLNSVNTAPVFHPVSQLVYAANTNNVTDVWVAGKQLLDNRQLTTIDEPALMQQVALWQTKFA